jgi:hypothetical protein
MSKNYAEIKYYRYLDNRLRDICPCLNPPQGSLAKVRHSVNYENKPTLTSQVIIDFKNSESPDDEK